MRKFPITPFVITEFMFRSTLIILLSPLMIFHLICTISPRRDWHAERAGVPLVYYKDNSVSARYGGYPPLGGDDDSATIMDQLMAYGDKT